MSFWIWYPMLFSVFSYLGAGVSSIERQICCTTDLECRENHCMCHLSPLYRIISFDGFASGLRFSVLI